MSSVHQYISKNLSIMKKDELSFPFLDFGFLYGYGLFESIKIEDGQPQLLQKHINRLKRGAVILEIPFTYSNEEIHDHIRTLIKENAIEDSILNFYLTPGDRGADPANMQSNSPFFLVVLREWPNYPKDFSVSLELRQESFKKTPLDRFKTLSWMKNALEKRLNPDVDDVLLFDENGYILETSRANVFFIKNDMIFTPKSPVILPGIIREFLLENDEVLGLPIREADVHLDDIESFDDIFLTNSLRGIFFVNEISENAHLKSGEKAKAIQKKFLELISKETKSFSQIV